MPYLPSRSVSSSILSLLCFLFSIFNISTRLLASLTSVYKYSFVIMVCELYSKQYHSVFSSLICWYFASLRGKSIFCNLCSFCLSLAAKSRVNLLQGSFQILIRYPVSCPVNVVQGIFDFSLQSGIVHFHQYNHHRPLPLGIFSLSFLYRILPFSETSHSEVLLSVSSSYLS